MLVLSSTVTGLEFWTFVHILSVVIGFGLLFSLLPMVRFVERSAQQSAVSFYGAVLRICRLVVTPSMVLLLISGLFLVGESSYGFGEPWVSASFAVLIALFGLVGAALIPTLRRLAVVSGGTAEAGKGHRKVVRQLVVLIISADVLVLAALFLMATKPGG